MKRLLIGAFSLVFISCNAQEKNIIKIDNEERLSLTDKEWKEKLTNDEYKVLREGGTETPYTNEYNKHYKSGKYICAGCNNPLFDSETKYDSGSGWPAFYDAIDKSKIKEIKDISAGMVRAEVRCARCNGHLGHVFEDGPRDKTGLRYCINSISLNFIKEGEK